MRKLAPLLLIMIAITSSINPRFAAARAARDAGPNSVVFAAAATSLLSNGSFEQLGLSWLSPWSLMVSSPAIAVASQDFTTAASGRASAGVTILRATPGTSWNVELKQQNLSLIANATYTLTFSAKGTFRQSVEAMVQQSNSPWAVRADQTYPLTGSWQQFTLRFTAPASESGIKVQFNLAQATGKVWLDSVSLTTAASSPPTATATAVPPTATSTALVPTATSTAIAPTATGTSVPPTATSTTAAPTATSTVVPPTATPTIGTIPAGTVQDFPRVASIYSFDSSSQASTFSRYGQVVASLSSGPSGAVQALKNQSPSTRVIFYLDTSAVKASTSDGLSIYPGWWLTLAGTTLAAPLDATSTTVQVVNASIVNANLSSSPDVLVDGESMHVVAVNIGANTLTVQRGYYSTASPHAAGTRIAAHASNWSGVWMLNITPYCPINPSTGQTWASYLAQRAKIDLRTGPWDGVFFDNSNSNWTTFANGQLDANNDNVADGGNGPSGTGWKDGETNLYNLTHTAAPTALLVGNGGYYPGYSNGQEMEHFPFYSSGWASGLTSYLQVAGPGTPAAATILNADTSNTGSQNLQSMRFNLATALMGNGYYSYDYGTQNHGQTWWYDEYDNGAGSSLASPIDASQTSLILAPGTGSKFKVGDVVHAPGSANDYNDEQMLVTAINGDILIVQRGVNGTQAITHPALSKVSTQAQLAAGLGWLGQPQGAGTPQTLTSPSQMANGDFEQAGANWLSPWSLSTNAPAAATISQDTSTAESGTASAKIVVSQASPGVEWNAALAEHNISLTAGTAYTLSFWAKSDNGQSVSVAVQQDVSPWTSRSYQTFTMTSAWQRYSLTFTAPVSESAIKIQFNVAQSVGTMWLDNVSFQQGDPNLWRRDFAHGTVLLNASSAPQTVAVGPGYRRIAGTQDAATNNGAAVTTVTIPAQDALLLVKTS